MSRATSDVEAKGIYDGIRVLVRGIKATLLSFVFTMFINPEKKRDDAVVVVSDAKDVLQAETRRDVERRLVRKLDFRLLPTVFIIYFMNIIDVRCFSTCWMLVDLYIRSVLLSPLLGYRDCRQIWACQVCSHSFRGCSDSQRW